jgi:hypothetical protein
MRSAPTHLLWDPCAAVDTISSGESGMTAAFRTVFPVVHTLYVLLREG